MAGEGRGGRAGSTLRLEARETETGTGALRSMTRGSSIICSVRVLVAAFSFLSRFSIRYFGSSGPFAAPPEGLWRHHRETPHGSEQAHDDMCRRGEEAEEEISADEEEDDDKHESEHVHSIHANEVDCTYSGERLTATRQRGL